MAVIATDCAYCRTQGRPCAVHGGTAPVTPPQERRRYLPQHPRRSAPRKPPVVVSVETAASPPGPQRRKGRQAQWPQERIVAAIQTWSAHHEGNGPGFWDYANDTTLPSPTTVYNVLGSLANAHALAGVPVRQRGQTQKARHPRGPEPETVPRPTKPRPTRPKAAAASLLEILPPPIDPLDGSPMHPARRWWWDTQTHQPVEEES
jgi:hypothetical protein